MPTPPTLSPTLTWREFCRGAARVLVTLRPGSPLVLDRRGARYLLRRVEGEPPPEVVSTRALGRTAEQVRARLDAGEAIGVSTLGAPPRALLVALPPPEPPTLPVLDLSGQPLPERACDYVARWLDAAAARGLTAAQIRSALGYTSTATVSQHRRGRRRVGARELAAYAALAAAPAEELTAALHALSRGQ